MKLKTLFIALVLIAGLAYLSAKGYIYYKTKTGLDKIIQLASPIAQIDYASIGSKLTGTIFVDGVSITPTGTYDNIKIKRISVSGNGFKFLFDLARGFTSNELPSQANIAYDRLEAPVSMTFLSRLASSLTKDGDSEKIKTCSIPGILNAMGLKNLNLTTVSMNGSVGYIYDKDINQAEITLKYDLIGVESMLLDLRVSQFTTQGTLNTGKLPVIEQLHLVKQYEPDYIRKIIMHCATEASQSTAAFVDDLFTQSDEYYINSLGFIPGPGLSELLRQLVTNAGTVEIRATPSSEITPALLKAYRPEDLVDLFGVTASYNGIPVKDLSFSMQSSMPQKVLNSPSVASATPSSQVKARPKPKLKLRYLDTDVSDLNRYINHMVRAYTQNNSIPKEGILVSITNNTVNIEHLVFSGKFTSHLHTDSIERVEVLRKEMPEDK